MKAINVNKITKCGGVFTFWIADWFALLNNKMGGDLEKIRVVGRYFVEVWKAAGMNLSNVRFLWASEEINARADEYWSRVMDISRTNNITRIKKCCTIMGRGEGDEMPSAQILYPCMQCADIFFLKADVCQLGLDQRKVNMLARDYCTDPIKPVILSHHMLLGLKKGQEKMSKSDPDSAIFMEDSAKDVERKINQGFCPELVVENNPIMDYAKYIVLPAFDNEWEIKIRKENDFISKVYRTNEELDVDFKSGELHPGDLKPAVAKAINKLLQPVRDHFNNDAYARNLLETIKRWQVELAAKK
jgi:tyrosyl-tRNA synthetase